MGTYQEMENQLTELKAKQKKWITDNWRRRFTHSAADMVDLDRQIDELESRLQED